MTIKAPKSVASIQNPRAQPRAAIIVALGQAKPSRIKCHVPLVLLIPPRLGTYVSPLIYMFG